jgi:hypothetical protein
MSEEFKKVESLVDQFKEYVNTRLAQAKLSIAEKVSGIAALMIAILMSALVFFLFLVLVSVAAAIAIGQWLDNAWLGFLIMAGIVLLIGFLLWLSKDRLLRIPIMNMLIHALFDKEDNEEED